MLIQLIASSNYNITTRIMVRRYETTDQLPALDTLVRLADALGTSTDYLPGARTRWTRRSRANTSPRQSLPAAPRSSRETLPSWKPSSARSLMKRCVKKTCPETDGLSTNPVSDRFSFVASCVTDRFLSMPTLPCHTHISRRSAGRFRHSSKRRFGFDPVALAETDP